MGYRVTKIDMIKNGFIKESTNIHKWQKSWEVKDKFSIVINIMRRDGCYLTKRMLGMKVDDRIGADSRT